MHFHWQNLNEDKRDVLHGRAWWHFGRRIRGYPGSKVIQLAWRIGRWEWAGLIFTTGADEADYGVSFGIGFLQLYLQLSGFRAFDSMRRCVFGFDTGIRLYGEMLTLQWNNDDSSTEFFNDSRGRRVERDAHGWRRTWLLLDVLLGKAKYSKRSLSYSGMYLHMPEKLYYCTVLLHRDKWTRPRWPWPLRIDRATIEIPNGVPIPGKGTESYNCGEDCCNSLTTPASSMPEAMAALQASVMETRLKRGGPDWKPEKMRNG